MQADTGLSGLSGIINVYLLQDLFSGTNGTHLSAHTMNIGPGWTAGTHELSLLNGAATNTDAGSASEDISDSGQSTVTANGTVQLTDLAVNGGCGLIIRGSDTSNYYLAYWQKGASAQFALYTKVAGAYTQRASTNVTNDTNPHSMQVSGSGNTVTAYLDGGNSISYTSSFNNTATKCGVFADYQTVSKALVSNFNATSP
jgi:hypothetical protein